jgi:hypothetical protein
MAAVGPMLAAGRPTRERAACERRGSLAKLEAGRRAFLEGGSTHAGKLRAGVADRDGRPII